MKRRVLVMGVVLVMHALLLAAAWFARVELPRHEQDALVVSLLGDPTPPRDAKPQPPPVRLMVPTPLVSITDVPMIHFPVVEAAGTPAPVVRAAAVAAAAPAPENLGTELAVQCPDRTPPRYPAVAKRQREQGEVRLKVELDENGRIDTVTVISSSGSPRLDEAARTAILAWRCRPAEREGRPVRAVALQSLAFVLEHH